MFLLKFPRIYHLVFLRMLVSDYTYISELVVLIYDFVNEI